MTRQQHDLKVIDLIKFIKKKCDLENYTIFNFTYLQGHKTKIVFNLNIQQSEHWPLKVMFASDDLDKGQ